MTVAKYNTLFLGILFMLIPPALFAQNRQVALIPFWGDNDLVISQFGDELFSAMTRMDGFQPVRVDMVNLPADVPPGGFPPFVAPSLSLTRDAPFAITGNVILNPISGQWNLRLFLWQMEGNRLIFSEEMAAPDRAFAAVIMPFVLGSLMAQIPEDRPPDADPIVETVIVEVPVEVIVHVPAETVIVEVPVEVPVEVIVEVPVEVIVEVPVPTAPIVGHQMIVLDGQQVVVYHEDRARHNWLYFGLRAGGNLQMFNPLWSAEGFGAIHWENTSAAMYMNLQIARFLGIQFEGIAMQDFQNDTFSLMFPALLRLTARRNTSSFSFLGGFYLLLPVSGPGRWGDDPGIVFVDPSERVLGSTGWGYTAGFSMGNRLGPGHIFTELRWSNDMFSGVRTVTDYPYSRSMVTVSIGFEAGFFRRR